MTNTPLPRREVQGKHGGRGFELEPDVLNDTSDVLTFLRTRRSSLAADITAPGPDEAQLDLIMEAATRVPDHGKLTPWRFIVFQGKGREELADIVDKRWKERLAKKIGSPNYLDIAALIRANPLVICVISSIIAHPKVPAWEQELSAGAVCLNMVHAAIALGFAAQWRSGWLPFDEEIDRALGIGENERIAGFVHIGTRKADAPPLTDRRRPFWRDLTTFRGGK